MKGAPNQPVTVMMPPGSPYTFGNTDGSGNWSTSGSWVAGNAGSYTEYWAVGGVPAMPTVIFTVYVNLIGISPDRSPSISADARDIKVAIHAS